MLSGTTLAPLTQPLGALLKGEHENDLKGKERKIQGDPGTIPYLFSKRPPSFLNVPGVQHRYTGDYPGPGFHTSTSPPFDGVLPLCMGVAASVFLSPPPAGGKLLCEWMCNFCVNGF